MRGRDAEAYERFSGAVEWPMLLLALAFLPLLVVPLVWEVGQAAQAALQGAAWLIWAAFVAEYAIKLYLAADKRAMVRSHVLDLLIIVLPFLRPLRGLQVLRVVQASAAMGRAGVAARRLLTRRGFSAFLAITFTVIVLSGLLAWVFERAHPEAGIGTPLEGAWWALVTATTVGYGDMVPVSPEGRGVAVLLMLVGIALLSVVTANIAAFFVEESGDAELAAMREELRATRNDLQRHQAHLAAFADDLAHRRVRADVSDERAGSRA